VNGPILSYVTAHRWYVACLIALAVSCAIAQCYEWHTRRKGRMYIDTPPMRDLRGSQAQFEAIRRMYPRSER